MGRVVRGMGAMGWEGASDMIAADGGAIGRLGGSGDGDRRAMGGLAVVLMNPKRRRRGAWRDGSCVCCVCCDRGDPLKVWRAEQSTAARFFLSTQHNLGQEWRPKQQ